MYLSDILAIPELENSYFETKARLDRQNVEGWLKTVAGFSNAEGGTLIIGAEDNSGKLIGFESKEADLERNFFNNQVNEHIFPRPIMKISFPEYTIRDKSLFLVRVDISESPIKPVVVNYKGKPSIYMRREGFTNGATYEEIFNMCINCSRVQYDMTDTDTPYNRNDFSRLQEFCRSHNEGKELSDKALASMGFYSNIGNLKNGALLFSDSYKGDKTKVQCSVFSGFTRGTERIVTVNRYEGNLIDSIQFMMDFISQRMNHSLLKLKDRHVEIPSYPERALFEGIVNAVAHRDYYLDGTQIQIDMFRDRLEISSPGGFFQSGKIGKTYNLSNIISKRRNELICNVLVACKVMEAAGTGFDKIMQEYENADTRHRPFVTSTTDHFTLVLPDLTYSDGLSDTNALVDIAYTPIRNGSKYDEKILAYCYETPRSVSSIAAFLSIADSTYFRKNILQKLVDLGYLSKERVNGSFMFKTNRDHVSESSPQYMA